MTRSSICVAVLIDLARQLTIGVYRRSRRDTCRGGDNGGGVRAGYWHGGTWPPDTVDAQHRCERGPGGILDGRGRQRPSGPHKPTKQATSGKIAASQIRDIVGQGPEKARPEAAQGLQEARRGQCRGVRQRRRRPPHRGAQAARGAHDEVRNIEPGRRQGAGQPARQDRVRLQGAGRA